MKHPHTLHKQTIPKIHTTHRRSLQTNNLGSQESPKVSSWRASLGAGKRSPRSHQRQRLLRREGLDSRVLARWGRGATAGVNQPSG